MKTAAVIAEFNPFHNGHKHLFDTIRSKGYERIVVVMSGYFVQRGEPALVDPFVRTDIALKQGADLVLLIPTYYASSSAEFFAKGAVSVLCGLADIDALFFGCENDELSFFTRIASVLEEEPLGYRTLLKENLKNGEKFPIARKNALQSFLNLTSDQIAALSMPNNILAIEYCRALLFFHSSITPVPVKREGENYHSQTISAYASASAIRNHLLLAEPSFEIIKDSLPAYAYETLLGYQEQGHFLSAEDFSFLLNHCLQKEQDYCLYADCNDALASRITKYNSEMLSFQELCDKLSTKEMTKSRVSRVLFHILLNLKQSTLLKLKEEGFPTYLRVLGLRNGSGNVLLRELGNQLNRPIITRPSAFHETGLLQDLFDADLYASDLYRLVYHEKTAKLLPKELCRTPVIQ